MILAVYDHNRRIGRLLNNIKQKSLFVLVFSVFFGCFGLGLLGRRGGPLWLDSQLSVLDLLIFNFNQHFCL